MCDENGLFAEAEVTDGMLVSRRRFKRNVIGGLLRLKDRILIALDLQDEEPTALAINLVLMLVIVALIINGFVEVFHLLEINKSLTLPLGSTWSITQ